MIDKIMQRIIGKDCDLRERMFRTIILVAGIATIIGLGECFFVMKIENLLVPIVILILLAMGLTLFFTFKYQKYNLAAMLLGLIIIVMVFPAMFFFSGGIESGATIWLALGIIYIFSMFKGIKLVCFLILCVTTYGTTYIVGYHHSEWIIPMISKSAYYVDSFFSVFVVGGIAGFILKAQMKVYEEEHKINIKQKEEIEKSRDSKNVLFANMNHEIRTPINAIVGLNEMIIRENADEKIKRYSKDIQTASNLLLNQVNDILDLSQMEMGRMKIIPMKYRTDEMFKEIIELVRFQMEKKELEFLVDIDKNLPSVLLGDEKRIKQILINILDNARKYTEKGSVILTVQGEKLENDIIEIEMKVADTGIGIRNEDLQYIYESFNRFDEKKNTRILGSGLGLAITKQLVDLMGGEISVDSIYRKGTVFTITIRQKIEDETSIGSINLSKSKSGEDEKYKPSFEAPEARVLIVDDNKMNSKVAASLLEATKMQIDVVSSGKECLEMTKKKYYNIILLDHMMPIMDGPETLNNIRKQENGLCRDSAIIALTGNTFLGAREAYEREGFDGYAEKPIKSKELEKEILKFLVPDIIEYLDEEVIEAENISIIQKATLRKRKKIYITTDCVCDIPPELLEKYEVKLMYLYIKTPNGRFADTREIDSDSLKQYISAEHSVAYGDAVTVEEYEEFFSEALTEAERVIHISLASKTGRAYGIAVEAAKGFDHVTVVDSGMISCGQGLIVLHAARMAMAGKTYDEIHKSVEKIKNSIQMRFIMPGADIFEQNGRISPFMAKICRTFQLRPLLTMKQSKPALVGLLSGSLENAWKKGIHKHLSKKRKICTDVVFITHVGCSVKQQDLIVKEVSKYVKFDKVIINKASFSNACNVGVESIGIAYYGM